MLYVVKCKKCGEVMEVLTHRPTSVIIHTCSKCGGVKFEKLPAAPNFKVVDGTPIFGGSK